MDFSGQYQQQQQGAGAGAGDPSQIQAYDPSMYAQYPQQSTDPSQIQSYDQSHYQQQQPADPSQIQPYDQSTQAYYAYPYNQGYNQQYYYPQDYYSNAYQQQYQHEPTSIHPPGVPIPPSTDPYATQQQPQYSYYPQQQGINYGEVATVTMPNVSTPTITPSPYKGKGKRGGRPYRGGAHGHLGGGQLQPIYTLPTYAENQPKVFQGASQIQGGLSQVKPSSSASGNSAPVRPPRMAWCELCRIECNTPEVLEQHKNGKKHKKNLKAYEERQKLNKQMDGAHGNQTINSEVKPRISYQPAVEGSGQLPLGHLPSETVTGDRQPLPQEKLPPQSVIEEDVGITGKQKVEETDPLDHIQGQGRGVKRNLRGGRGSKLMKTQNGSRKPAVPPKPQKMVPLICELCNVKCESVVVFQSHLAGRKHLSNVKDFQGQQAMVGQAALQALYPALQALYPALQALCQPNSGASTSVAPQGHQHNLHEILGILTQQALSAIPQDQLLGIGAAATLAIPQDQLLGIGAAVASAFSPPSDLLAQDNQGSKLQGSVSEETSENAAAEDGRNCDLPVLPSTESKPEENIDNKHENVNLEVEKKVMSVEEPLRFGTSGDVSSTKTLVIHRRLRRRTPYFSVIPGEPAMASTPVSELSDGPVLSVINKRLRALRKKHSRILQMEESRTKGKTLNKEQEETLRSKSAVIAAIDELEKLRQPLAAAVVEEINLSTGQHQVSPAESAVNISIDSTDKGEPAREGVLVVEDLLNLLYFGSMFDVKSLQSDFTPTMLTRTMERACCLSYDCMPDDESTDVMDLLGERDLDLISMLSGLLVSRPVNSPLSHKHALQKCIEHAKLWLSKSEQPIEPNSDATYAGLRSKLDKIIASLYFTTDPVKVEAAAGKYGSYSVPVEEHHVEAVPVDVPLQVDTPSVQYEQKEEAVSSQAIETNDNHISNNIELQQGGQDINQPAEPEEVVFEVEGVDNMKDADFNEQQSVPRRSYQNQNYRGNRGGSVGDRRGYSNGRGGRGRGGSYQNGRNQYYDQSGNYQQRNYNNYRGRGGRGTGGGGGYNHYTSGDQAGSYSADLRYEM